MQALLDAAELCSHLLGDLRPEEALRLRASCRAARVVMSAGSMAAAAFAVTRSWVDPVFGTLRQWCVVWSTCAAAAETLGFGVSDWASSGSQKWLFQNTTKPTFAPVASILAVKDFEILHESFWKLRFPALALLNNGEFATYIVCLRFPHFPSNNKFPGSWHFTGVKKQGRLIDLVTDIRRPWHDLGIPSIETRYAKDGLPYSLAEFLTWYDWDFGWESWKAAAPSTDPHLTSIRRLLTASRAKQSSNIEVAARTPPAGAFENDGLPETEEQPPPETETQTETETETETAAEAETQT